MQPMSEPSPGIRNFKMKGIIIAASGILFGGFADIATAEGENAANLRSRVAASLRSDGRWSSKAVDAYWSVNERRLTATDSVAPDLLKKELQLLGETHPKGKVMSLLENYPESSGLLLLAINKEALAAAIMDAPETDQGMLVASYWFCTNGTEVDEWTDAVVRHPAIISLLQRKCAALPFHGLFSYLKTLMVPEARKIYGKWLDEVMAPAIIGQSDETLSSRLTFVGGASVELRRRLDGHPDGNLESGISSCVMIP